MNRTNICKNIVQSIKDYITDQVKLEPHRMEKHFVRRRKLSLLQVIIYLFFSSKASMFQNLSQIREELGTLSFPDVSKQALSKARQFINPSLFKELYYLSVDLFYSQIPSRKLWQGYHLFAVDGSRIELPNSKSTFDFFGEMSSYPDPNRHYTMGLVSIIYDVLDDYILHASIHKFLSSERAAALEHLKVLEDMGLYNNSIIIFDRGYYSEDMFRELYFYRWPVELKYKELKSRFAMEEFSGATTVSIQQEFYINMLLSNLASLIKNEADEEIQISAKSTNKFRYQANRAFIIERIKNIVPKILCGLFELSIIEQLYTDAVRCRSQLLPGRSFPRKKLKSKGRSHFRNKKVSF
mgnify:CR=1 FL=1